MAVYTFQDARLLAGGNDLSGSANKLTMRASVQDKDVTVLNSGGYRSRIGGLADVALNASGFWDSNASSKPDDVVGLSNLGVSSTVFTVVPQSLTDGGRAYSMQGVQLGYDQGDAVGEVWPFSLSASGSTVMAQGTVLHPDTARTATGTGTIQQLGAVASGKRLYAALHVLAVSGTATPTLTVKVQSAALVGFGSPTDRITFTGATAVGAQWGSVAGPITDAFWRVSYTITGTNPSFTFVVTAGIK